MTFWDVLTLAGAIGSAVIAGVFFVFSVCVMRALGTLPPSHGMAAMQAINVVILNPLFLGVFVGTAAVSALVIAGAALGWFERASAGELTGGVLYLAGVLGVTRACNIPRNDRLAAVRPDAPDAAALWVEYLGTWTFWNHVRTLSAAAAAIAFAWPRWQ